MLSRLHRRSAPTNQLTPQLKDTYLHTSVEPSPPFTASSRATLTHLTSTLVDLYAKCVTRSDRGLAKQQLRLHQRENIAWERDTVWRQMIGRERRGEGVVGSGGNVGLGGASLVPEDELDDVTDADGTPRKVGLGYIPLPFLRFVGLGSAVRVRVTKKKIALLISIAVFAALLNTQTIEGDKEANKCFAVLMFCTLLWATEVGGFSR